MRHSNTRAMKKRIAIGVLWGLALAYGWQFWSAMYGLPGFVGPVLALIVAMALVFAPFQARGRASIPRRIVTDVPDPRVVGNQLGEPQGR